VNVERICVTELSASITSTFPLALEPYKLLGFVAWASVFALNVKEFALRAVETLELASMLNPYTLEIATVYAE
jgi:hypothetical protein